LKDPESNPTPTVPPSLRRSLEKLLWSDLPRVDATTAAIALSQFLRDLDVGQALSLPANPVVTADEDGEIIIVSIEHLTEAHELRISLDPSIARHIQEVAKDLDLDQRADFLWDLDFLLRTEIELLLLYEEMMLGHLILKHGEEAQVLLALSEDDWFEKHRTYHG
jgi:hypothetical protein